MSSKRKSRNNIKVLAQKMFVICLLVVFAYSVFAIGKSFAGQDTFTVKSVEVVAKSDTVEINNLELEKNTVKSNVTMHKVGDNYTYQIIIANNDEKNYTLQSITDDNTNEFITYKYQDYAGTIFNANESKDINITTIYSKEQTDTSKRNIDVSVRFILNFIDEEGNEKQEEIDITPTPDKTTPEKIIDKIVNPQTGDSVGIYIATAVASLMMLILFSRRRTIKLAFIKKESESNSKKTKVVKAKHMAKGKHMGTGFKFFSFLLIVTLIFPHISKAASDSISILFENNIKLMSSLVVKIDTDGDGTPDIEKTIKYNEPIGEIEDPEKDGYDFDGWEDENGNEFDPETTQITGDTTITPKFSPKTYTITYNGLTEEEKTNLNNPIAYTIEENVIITNPSNRYDGDGDLSQIFVGWEEGTSTSINITIPAGSVGNKEYTAKWEAATPDTYVITYDLQGGSVAGSNPIVFTKFDTFTLNNPTKTGYDFVGWTGSNGTTPETNVEVVEETRQSLNFTANYIPITYSILLKANGGVGEDVTSTHTYNEAKKLPANMFEKEGYGFAGWNTDANGAGTSYTDGQEILNITTTNNDVITLYAQWSVNTYTITFNSQGGSEVASKNVDYNAPLGALESPTKPGYTFNGWYSNNNPSVQVTENTLCTGADTLYAYWTIDTYTITYNGLTEEEKGSLNNPTTYTVEDSRIILNNPQDRLDGDGDVYESFAGWQEGDDQDGVSTYRTIEQGSTGSKTFTAKWNEEDPPRYTITYNTHGFATDLQNPEFYTKKTETFTLSNAEAPGYIFKGWSGTDLIGDDNQTVTIEKGSTGYRSYELHMTPITYDIVFKANGGVGEDVTETYTYDVNSQLPSNTFTREGYTFKEWNEAQDGTGFSYQPGDNVLNKTVVDRNVFTYYAIWEPNTYTIAYNVNTDGATGEMQDQQVAYDQAVRLIANTFAKLGFKFNGWDTNSEGTGTRYADEAEVINLATNGTVDLYAQWAVTPYTIIFDKNNENATGTMANMSVPYGEAVNLNPITYTYTDHKLKEWNTKADGTGTSYADKAEVINLDIDGEVTLYAQWRDVEAVFAAGSAPKTKMIALADGDQANITAIRQFTGTPDVTNFSEDNIISAETSPDPIYAWYDNGTIYYWSDDNHPALNSNSREMFSDLSNVTTIEIGNIDTTNTTNMLYMFKNCSKLESLDLDNFDTSNVTRMDEMFRGCSSLTELDVTGFDTRNVTNISGMFMFCSGLTELNVGNFDTSKVTNMGAIFRGCSGLSEIDISGFNTDEATSISGMFMECTGLTEIDLSNMSTPKVTDMSNLFRGCTNLENVIFGENFKAENVTTMQNMFMSCTSLRVVDLSGFEATKVTNTYQMFLYDNNLETIYVTNPDAFSNLTANAQDMFHSCSSLVGGMGTVQSQVYRSGERAFIDLGPERPGYFTDKTKLNIIYYPNGNNVTGTMEIQTTEANTDTPLSANQYVNLGYAFGGWNTKPDGTGTHYDNEQAVNGRGLLQIYAQWGLTPYTVIFDKNGNDATGTMENIQKAYGEHFNLPELGYTRSGYIFKGWNTKADGTGIHYDDEQAVINLDIDGEVTLYAEWLESKAEFNIGTKVNMAMKFLSGGAGSTASHNNTLITSIQRTINKPDISAMTTSNIVSSNNSKLPIYMWYDNGIIYWWTEAEEVYLNADSSYLYSKLQALENEDLTTGTNIDNLTDMTAMYNECILLSEIDFGDFDAHNVTSLKSTFAGCNSLTALDVSNFNTSQVTDMAGTFSGCNQLTELNVSGFDTRKVTSMSNMFNGCSQLTQLDVSNFNTSQVLSFANMFGNCKNLTVINVSNFDTSKATNISNMFRECNKVEELNVGNFNTENVTNMTGLFYNCKSITEIDVTNFDTSEVTLLNHTFLGMGVKELDLSSFDTSKVTEMQYTFAYDENLETIYVTENFTIESVKGGAYSQLMFYNCRKLVGGAGTTFSGQRIEKEMAHIDGGTLNPGYFTDKNRLNIFYYPNGSAVTGTMTNQTIQANTDTQLNANQYVNLGYAFGGWNTKPDGSGIHYDNGQVVSGYGRLELYAQWGLTPYTVIFDKNGNDATGIMENIQKAYGEHFNLPANTFSRDGYVFKGWNTKADGTGIHYDDEQEVVNLDIDSEVTLYAEWMETAATFDTGIAVNRKIGNLLANLENTVSMERSQVAPDIDSMTEANIVSSSTSNYAIYMWVDNDKLYWWSEVEKTFLNEDCTNMFLNTSKITSIDTSNLLANRTKYMQEMFRNCGVSTLDLSTWDTSQVENMLYMFYQSGNLTSINLSGEFSTSSAKSFNQMFLGCRNLEKLDLTNFDTGNVTDTANMFQGCSKLTSVEFGDDFTTESVTTMKNMFSGCSSLTSVDISMFNPDDVKDMSYMFMSCGKLESIDFGNSFVTSSLQNTGWMFTNCGKLSSLDFSNWDTSNVTNMELMLYGCGSLTTLDLSSWDTNNVKTMQSLLYNDKNLESITFGNNFNLRSAQNLSGMFAGCSKLTSLDLSTFETYSLINASDMFSGCSSLTSINFGDSFNTENTTNMSGMFRACHNITELDLSKFDTRSLTNMSNMFFTCRRVKTIYVSSAFVVNNVTSDTYTFIDCNELVGGLGTLYDSNYQGKEYARIDGGTSNPGYFTDIADKPAAGQNNTNSTNSVNPSMSPASVNAPLNTNMVTSVNGRSLNIVDTDLDENTNTDVTDKDSETDVNDLNSNTNDIVDTEDEDKLKNTEDESNVNQNTEEENVSNNETEKVINEEIPEEGTEETKEN